MPRKRNTPNYEGALFSFLRVLATNVATALLPLIPLSGELEEKYPTGKAIGFAILTASVLTVINFFRSGETRFGPPPNPGADSEEGYAVLGFIGVVLAVVGAVLLLLAALDEYLSKPGLVLLIVGAVLIFFDRDGRRLTR